MSILTKLTSSVAAIALAAGALAPVAFADRDRRGEFRSDHRGEQARQRGVDNRGTRNRDSRPARTERRAERRAEVPRTERRAQAERRITANRSELRGGERRTERRVERRNDR